MYNQPPAGYTAGAAANHGLGRRAQEIPTSQKCANQLWIYDNGYIKSRYNGLVLDVKGASKDKGAKVILYTPSGGRNQLWDITPDGYIANRDTGFVLDIPKGVPADKVELQVWEKKNGIDGRHQQWTWDEYGFITSKLNPNFALDLPGREDKPGKNLILYTRHALG